MTTNTFTFELNTLRGLHDRARMRAREAWAACVDLSMCRVWLPVEATRTALAEAIYYNAGYDACERHGSVADFKDALSEDLDGTWPAREMRGSVECYVTRPFMGTADDASYFGHLGLYGVSPLRLDDLKGLRVEPGVFGKALTSGLSAEESEVLLAFHRRSILTLVNLLRKLETALAYLTRAIASKEFNALDSDPACLALVDKLSKLAHLESFGPTAPFFGTDADKRNVLREFNLEAALTEFGVDTVAV